MSHPVRKSQQDTRFLLPSEIHYFSRVRNWSELASEERLASIDLTAYAKRLMSHDSAYPKLQVTQLEGRWYALNSLQLAICRHLERNGYCKRIRVNVCSAYNLPTKVAEGLQQKPGVEEAASPSTTDDDEDSDEKNDCDDPGAASSCKRAGVGGSCGDNETDDASSCSGSDSYCSECEREAREAETGGDAATAAGPVKLQQSQQQLLHKCPGRLHSENVRVNNASAAAAAASAESQLEFSDDGLSLDRDLADLGPTTAMLLQQLDLKQAAAAAAAAAAGTSSYHHDEDQPAAAAAAAVQNERQTLL